MMEPIKPLPISEIPRELLELERCRQEIMEEISGISDLVRREAPKTCPLILLNK